MERLLLIILICLISVASIFTQNSLFELKLIAKLDADLGKNGQIGFSPNGKYFFALKYKKSLQVWETETQKTLYIINGKFESTSKFSPNGKWLVVFSEKEGQILDFETGKILLRLNNYKEKIRFLNWGPNSQKFAVFAFKNAMS